MPLVPPTAGLYPTIEDVFNYTRIHINDTFAGATQTVGEGRIFTDNWTPSVNVLNLALQAMQRDLENYGLPTTREVTFVLTGIPPVNGPLGLGVPDPSIQVYIGFPGYYDGNIAATVNTSFKLPVDLLVPIHIGQRVTGSGTVFTEVVNAADDLPSVNQNYLLGFWTWRQDRLYFNGSQSTMDIELRYTGGVPRYPIATSPSEFDSIYIPFLDSGDALSYKCAYIFCSPRLPKGGADELQANYEAAMLKIANRWIKTAQRTPVSRQAFGGDGGSGASGEGWW
jgi:hypothetical protein